MNKNLSGGGTINYGPTLPTASQAPVGSLFFKTDSVDSISAGLYILNFQQDISTGSLGDQVGLNWTAIVKKPITNSDISGTYFVFDTGATSPGPQTFPSLTLSGLDALGSTDFPGSYFTGFTSSGINGTRAAQFIMGWDTIGGEAAPSKLYFRTNDDTGDISAWSTWTKIWNENNDGAGSGLDADLLDGQDGSYYLNAGNISSGVLPISRGGTGNSAPAAIGGIVYGASSTSLSTVAGSSGQVLTSNGSVAPTWVNPSTLSVGHATTADSANSATTAGSATTATTAGSATTAGTATTAGKWTTARTITLTGDVTGSTTIDGSANVTIATSANVTGATGGGTDRVFYENDQVVTTNYTITAGKNAMTAGPITINSGVVVTVPSGSVWTII